MACLCLFLLLEHCYAFVRMCTMHWCGLFSHGVSPAGFLCCLFAVLRYVHGLNGLLKGGSGSCICGEGRLTRDWWAHCFSNLVKKGTAHTPKRKKTQRTLLSKLLFAYFDAVTWAFSSFKRIPYHGRLFLSQRRNPRPNHRFTVQSK